MRHPRYVCIHGHFYQPPRKILAERGGGRGLGRTIHDWNERITRECYAPNTRSRLLDGQGRITHLLNNYAWISFNFGPTLLQWMAEAAPEAYQGIIEADRLSRERRSGHGNALAQNFNHTIMPLASRHDKETQVVWGIADFRRDSAQSRRDVAGGDGRGRRNPRGTGRGGDPVHDPGTPAGQAVAEVGHEDLGGRSPTGSTRRAPISAASPPGDRSAVLLRRTLFRAVAFERLLDSGERFLDRLFQGFDDDREHAQLMHIATDGESYGHHHPHGDMALAYALDRLAPAPRLRLTNYGEFLELHPPEWEVEIHENSSWSCAERQAPAFRLRMPVPRRLAAGMAGPLPAPRRPQDAARSPLRNPRPRVFSPTPGSRAATSRSSSTSTATATKRSPASSRSMAIPTWTPSRLPTPSLLEMQQDAMLMFTSCGWFHDELSGIETVQCLQYAARAIHLAKRFHRDFEPEFVAAFQEAPSNVAKYRDGRGVWEQLVRPASSISTACRAPCHQPRLRTSRRGAGAARDSFDLETIEHEVRRRGPGHLAIGRLTSAPDGPGTRPKPGSWSSTSAAWISALLSQGTEADASDAFEAFQVELLETYRPARWPTSPPW